jgi:hypothetical protein
MKVKKSFHEQSEMTFLQKLSQRQNELGRVRRAVRRMNPSGAGQAFIQGSASIGHRCAASVPAPRCLPQRQPHRRQTMHWQYACLIA